MAFTHGKNTNFQVQDNGGVTQDISAYLDSVSFPNTVTVAETTTFGNAAKTYIVGLEDGKISLAGLWDPTLDGILAGIKGFATARSFIYGPAGTTTGNVKYTGSVILTAYNVDSPVAEAAKWTAELQITGVVTRTTF